MVKSAQRPAVIYCRVSSTRQKKDGDGLRSQETHCRNYAKYHDLKVVRVFHDDFTGKVPSRPAIDEMGAFLRDQTEPHAVIIDHISRWARDIEAHWQLRRAIGNSGGILVSPSMEFRDDSSGRFQENILASSAQYQREQNAEQVVNRMQARCMNGYWCFWPPAGYRYAKVKDHGKLLVRHEPFATIIQEALEGFAAGRFQTQAETARFITSHPQWTRSSRAKLGDGHMLKLLTNPLYAGFVDVPRWKLNMVPAKHEPLISFATHQRIHARIKGTTHAPARKNVMEDFALRNFVTCHSCDKPLQGCWSKGRTRSYPYYLCATKGCSEYGKSIRRDEIEGQFGELLGTMRPSPPLFAAFRDIFAYLWDARAAKAKTEAEEINAELKAIDETIAQLVDRIVSTTVAAAAKACEERIGQLERRKIELNERMATACTPTRDFQTGFRTAMDFLENPQKLWLSGRYELRRIVLKLAFAGRIGYVRNEGFRTALTSLPFTLLSRAEQRVRDLVELSGIEPLTSSLRTTRSPN